MGLNEYGAKLDSNGYATSVLCNGECCFLCGRGGDLIRHEVFHGIAYRKKSKRLGAWVLLCPTCHEKVHSYASVELPLKRTAQITMSAHYEWDIEDFRREWGRSYL